MVLLALLPVYGISSSILYITLGAASGTLFLWLSSYAFAEGEKFEHEAGRFFNQNVAPVDASYTGQQYWYMYGAKTTDRYNSITRDMSRVTVMADRQAGRPAGRTYRTDQHSKVQPIGCNEGHGTNVFSSIDLRHNV